MAESQKVFFNYVSKLKKLSLLVSVIFCFKNKSKMGNRNFVHFDEDGTILNILSDINPALKRLVLGKSCIA